MILTPLRIDLRWVTPARLACKGPFLPHLCLDFLDMIEIVGERCVYFGKRKGRYMRDNLIGG